MGKTKPAKGAKQKKGKKKPAKGRTILIPHDADDLLQMACRAVFEEGKASTSLIQRKLKIAYARAAHLLDRLEELKLVGPLDGAKPRSVRGTLPTLKRKKVVPDKIEPVPSKNPVGQPTIYTAELAATICSRIAHGESLRQICRDDAMPAMSTIMNWLLEEEKKDFRKLYENARELQCEVLFDETLEIADDGTNDWVERETDEGRTIEVFDHEHVQRSKLRVDTRKWFISKVLPKKYGEKLDVTSGNKPIKEAKPAVINYLVPEKPAE